MYFLTLNDDITPSDFPITDISADFNGTITCVKICGIAIVNIYGVLYNLSGGKTIAAGLPRAKNPLETLCITSNTGGVSSSILMINESGVLFVNSAGNPGSTINALIIYRYNQL